ncbi:MAG: type II toxin-antitoxin system prevent-host-death family antitoxin [Gemmatimonadaceae bacterium]
MFTVRGPRAAIATATELRRDVKGTFAEARERDRVYVTSDGKPLGMILSIEMGRLFDELLEERRLARIATDRLRAIRDGTDTLLDEDEFWAAAERRVAAAHR